MSKNLFGWKGILFFETQSKTIGLFFHYCKITKETVQFLFSSDQFQFKSVGWGLVLLAAFVCCAVRPNI